MFGDRCTKHGRSGSRLGLSGSLCLASGSVGLPNRVLTNPYVKVSTLVLAITVAEMLIGLIRVEFNGFLPGPAGARDEDEVAALLVATPRARRGRRCREAGGESRPNS